VADLSYRDSLVGSEPSRKNQHRRTGGEPIERVDDDRKLAADQGTHAARRHKGGVDTLLDPDDDCVSRRYGPRRRRANQTHSSGEHETRTVEGHRH
jgi:hypothetical protein